MLGAGVIDIETRARLVRLETEFKAAMDRLDGINSKVTQMHELLTQAKGVRWLILTMVAIGGFAAAKLTTVAQWFGAMPR